ncbi:organophosphate reductase [Lactobacillus selangorensis]|uniref:Organophosphate reductase n=1 Tax=Lactobacillus selangorensis TaxID=81857 RepID=A0A0R2FXS4_9LACO|nr:aldo/keto reductase [Lactobacillus selangorensis]KRN28685.1 organophosphate reductase [Lactobacillus selangorensis]KRN32904.1 organophosphate reductase [Lactobacillus selangorensis]
MTDVPMIPLNNGVEMPALGFGVFQIHNLIDAKTAVSEALQTGYRMIDTATAYQNEEAVGQAIQESNIRREDIFVTSKLWVSDFTYERAKEGIDASLQRLGLDYMDLYLLHQPYGDVVGAWRALEEARQAGKIRAIGVSNFYEDQLKNLELSTSIKPAVNQIEVNPWFQQTGEVDFNQAEDVRVEAWAPFAEGKHGIFKNEALVAIGQKYGKSAGQVILRWLLQRGITVIPKSVHQKRMAENIDVFDFELTADDMEQIATLDKGESQFFDHRDPVAIEQIFGTSLKQTQQ